MNPDWLPPKPDIHTGLPRPPVAPRHTGNSPPGDRHDFAKSPIPQPPPGEGPLLEWYYPDRGTRLVGVLFIVVIMMAVYTWKDWGLGWMSNIWLWLLILPWIPLAYIISGRTRMSAGADWLACGKHSFVKTYELTSIKVSFDQTGYSIKIKDSRTGSVSEKINELQSNHELWDLVYNGILHSVHIGGAETNKRAREYLFLDYPPHLTRT